MTEYETKGDTQGDSRGHQRQYWQNLLNSEVSLVLLKIESRCFQVVVGGMMAEGLHDLENTSLKNWESEMAPCVGVFTF